MRSMQHDAPEVAVPLDRAVLGSSVLTKAHRENLCQSAIHHRHARTASSSMPTSPRMLSVEERARAVLKALNINDVELSSADAIALVCEKHSSSFTAEEQVTLSAEDKVKCIFFDHTLEYEP